MRAEIKEDEKLVIDLEWPYRSVCIVQLHSLRLIVPVSLRVAPFFGGSGVMVTFTIFARSEELPVR